MRSILEVDFISGLILLVCVCMCVGVLLLDVFSRLSPLGSVLGLVYDLVII